MKKVLLLIIILSVGYRCHAQRFAWAGGWGAASYDEAKSLAYDDSGNVYITGSFLGTVDFDPGPGVHNAAGRTYVLKLNASGGFVWVKTIDAASAASVGWPHGTSICLDKAGNIIIGGSFQGIVDFDPGTAVQSMSSGGSGVGNGFILKLDAAGNFIWVKTLVANNLCNVLALGTDAHCNIYCTGYFAGQVDMDPGSAYLNYSSRGSNDGFIVRLDSSGNYQWSVQTGGRGDERGRSITADTAGNVYCTGYFTDTVDFDPGAATAIVATSALQSGFLTKFDAGGNFKWVRQLARGARSEGYGITIDRDNNVYVTGYYAGKGDFDPGAGVDTFRTVALASDGFISRFDTAGNYHRTRLIVGIASAFTLPAGIATDTFCNVYVCGSYRGYPDFDPGTGSYLLVSDSTFSRAKFDLFVLRLDSAGYFNWAMSIGGQDDEVCNAMGVTASGTIYAAGNYNASAAVTDSVDFDPGSGSSKVTGFANFFVARYNQCLPVLRSVTIAAHPGTTVYVGQTDTFTAAATGGGASPAYQWYVNGSSVAGATNAMYIATVWAGMDSVQCVVTPSDSCAAGVIRSNTLHINWSLSAQELGRLYQVVLAPNPTRGTAILTAEGLGGNTPISYCITDIAGRTIMCNAVSTENGRLSTPIELPAAVHDGIYLLRLYSAGGSEVIRFTVQR